MRVRGQPRLTLDAHFRAVATGTPHAPWRIHLTDDIRRRFIPEVPAGYVGLADAAAQTGLTRQTILNQIRRGDRDAIHVTEGQRRGLRVQLHPQEQGLLPAAPSQTP